MQQNEIWCLADLHVHTPASKDFKGDKTKNGYKEIIKKASSFGEKKEKNESSRRIVAITDHNSIDGYRTLCGLREEARDLQRLLRDRNPNHDYIKEIDEEVSLYESLVILPGIEIKPDPGVHLLLLFNDTVSLDSVEKYLQDGFGCNLDSFKGDPEPMLKWSIVQALDEVVSRFGKDVIVIAPHADSTSGIYEALKNLSQARITAFTHPALRAISFNNVENKRRMDELFNKPEYKRDKKPVFIQSSDYHGQVGIEIGYLHSKIRVDGGRLTFDGIVKSFSNQTNIKCSVDFINDTYKELISGKPLKIFKSYNQEKISISLDDHRDLCDVVCGFLNTNGGIVEIDVNLNKDDKKSLIDDFREEIEGVFSERLQPQKCKMGMRMLQYSASKYKLLLKFEKSNKLYMSDGKVIVSKMGGDPCPATAHEIECVVAKNISKKYGKDNERTLDNLSMRTKIISKAQSSFPIAVKCNDKLTFTTSDVFNVNDIDPGEYSEYIQSQINEMWNGKDNGDVCVVNDICKARFDDSYLRYTAPLFSSDDELRESSKIQETDCIIVAPGGGTYFCESGRYIHSVNQIKTLKLDEQDKTLAYLAWFKSTYFIWYCLVILKSVDIYMHFSWNMRKVPLPVLAEGDFQRLNSYANNIIINEKNFLKSYVKLNKDGSDKNQISQAIVKHNNSCNSLCFQIDMLIFELLDLDKDDIDTIYSNIKELSFYDFGYDLNDEFKKKIESIETRESCRS